MGREDKNWELINQALAAESSGRAPRLFSSRKTLFGIPSQLDQELSALSDATAQMDNTTQTARSSRAVSRTAHHVIHPLKPIFDSNSKILILGTMPSPTSRETGFYYNHPQNRFWKVMAALFSEETPATNEQKEDFILQHNLALWDVLAQCSIEGASDATIAECVPNDIALILKKAPIEAIFCTGAKAYELYVKYCETPCGIKATRLPSTSSANAAMSLNSLIQAYEAITQAMTS